MSSFDCTICSASFGRNEHLKRHLASHVGQKNYRCCFCEKTYQRSDALRRHQKTCGKRIASGIAIPVPGRGGKRKRACDACTTAKRPCNLDSPCAECSLQNNLCTYRRLQNSTTTDSRHVDEVCASDVHFELDHAANDHLPTNALEDPDWLTKILASEDYECIDEIDGLTNVPLSRLQLEPLEFILNFTSTTGVNSSYNYGRNLEEPSLFAEPESVGRNHHHDRSSAVLSQHAEWELCTVVPTAHNSGPGTNDSSQRSRTFKPAAMSDSIDQKVREIRAILANARHTELRRGEDLTPTDLASIDVLFSSESVAIYCDYYWMRWHPHCPIVHKPTFEKQKTHALLLMSIVLMGACTSLRPADRQQAKILLDVAEAAVLSHPVLRSVSHDGDFRDGICVLQSAYLICIMQKWEGSEETQQHVRRYTFPTFVTAVRSFCSRHAVRREACELNPTDREAWLEYIWNERLIRTITYVFLLDCSFSVFHNSMPRMVLREVRIQLPCTDACFSASSPEDFNKELEAQPEAIKTRILLPEVIRMLCAENPGTDIDMLFKGTSNLSLFLVMTTLHSLIFYQRMSFVSLPVASEPLGRAIKRWELLWAARETGRTTVTVEDGGFMCHALDFAMLAKIQLRRAMVIDESGTDAETTGSGHLQSDTDFDGLSQLDQTSMSEANKLLGLFSKLEIV